MGPCQFRRSGISVIRFTSEGVLGDCFAKLFHKSILCFLCCKLTFSLMSVREQLLKAAGKSTSNQILTVHAVFSEYSNGMWLHSDRTTLLTHPTSCHRLLLSMPLPVVLTSNALGFVSCGITLQTVFVLM